MSNICYNCSSSNLILTHENITCEDCSHVQNDVFYSKETNSAHPSEDITEFINEFHQRENLSEKERNFIDKRLSSLKTVKSAFSKLELSLALIYLAKAEGGSVKSLQAFIKSHGSLVVHRKMDLCLSHIRRVLKLRNKTLNWSVLLEPYSRKYLILKDYDKKILEKACEKIHRESCMNIFSVTAIAIASYFNEFFPHDKNKNLTSVVIFSGVSRATLKKNAQYILVHYLSNSLAFLFLYIVII